MWIGCRFSHKDLWMILRPIYDYTAEPEMMQQYPPLMVSKYVQNIGELASLLLSVSPNLCYSITIVFSINFVLFCIQELIWNLLVSIWLTALSLQLSDFHFSFNFTTSHAVVFFSPELYQEQVQSAFFDLEVAMEKDKCRDLVCLDPEAEKRKSEINRLHKSE